MFNFKSGFYKRSWQGIAVLVIIFANAEVFSQTETNTTEKIDLKAEYSIIDVVDIKKNTSDINLTVQEDTSLKIDPKTKQAIVALSDGIYLTANEIARYGLNKCVDFSTLNAEVLFHVVMGVNKTSVLGDNLCLELLDSTEQFGLLWGSDTIKEAPKSFAQSVTFWKACCLADLNRHNEAIELLRGLIKENNFNYDFLKVEVLRRLCYELVLSGELEEATTYYATTDLPALSDPISGESVALFKFAYAQALLQLNKSVEAENVLKALINELNKNSSVTASAFLLNMELLLVNGQPANAVALFEGEDRKTLFSGASQRVKALLLCKYAQALASVEKKDQQAIEKSIAEASNAVDTIYSLEDKMVCMETLIKVLASVKSFDDVKIRITSMLEYAPNSIYVARVLRQVANSYQASGEYNEAYWAYLLYLHSFTDNPFEYDVMVDCGDCLVQLGKNNEAALQFKRASEFATEDGKKNLANFKAGRAYYDANRFVLAAECFKSIVPNVEAQEDLYVVSQLYYAQSTEKFDKNVAKQIYEKLSLNDNIDLKEPALISVAALLTDDGDTEKAREAYVKLIDLSKEAPRESYALGLLGCGLIELKSGKYVDALNMFEKAEKAQNGGEHSIRAAFLKTEAFYLLGQDNNAYSNTVAFLEHFPSSSLVVDADFWLAKYEFNSQNYVKASKLLLEFCEKWKDSPHAPVAHLLAIYSMLEQEKNADVVLQTAQWIKLYKDNELLAEVQYVNSEAMSRLLQFDHAAHGFAQAAKNAKSSQLKLRATMRQADCLYTLGADNPARYDEAIMIYNELMLMPGQHQSIVLQMAYKLAKCYEKQGNLEKAKSCYYNDVILRLEGWSHDANNAGVVNYLQTIGGSIWYARAIIDVATLYEIEGTEEAYKIAEALLKRLVNTQLPCADEAKLSLERIQNRFLKKQFK